MRLGLLALLLLSSCDSCLPESFRATPQAGFARMEAAKLDHCVRNNLCQFAPQCLAESRARCTDAGYDEKCGWVGQEASCGDDLR